MADETERDPLDTLVGLNFKITERERRSFKVWCAEHGISQVDAFRKGVELLKKQDGAPE